MGLCGRKIDVVEFIIITGNTTATYRDQNFGVVKMFQTAARFKKKRNVTFSLKNDCHENTDRLATEKSIFT